MNALYDQIGQSYRATRAADPRIVDRLVALLKLPPGATLCDIGAGSGNYTNALAARGFAMLAVEPSAVMRRQAKPQAGVRWLEGVAERLPLGDGAADGVVCTLAAHHFTCLATAVREMNRVSPAGPHLFFTFDPYAGEPGWFEAYFPEICKKDFRLFPASADVLRIVAEATGRTGVVEPFPLPADLIDQFMYAPWRRPETYLDPTFRQNTSGFASADPVIIEQRLGVLRDDLASGTWDVRYGALRQRASFDAGFRFVLFRSG
jgi:ubiquinone/menaquinone biosynthesis C-methylase UbiE